AFPFQGKSLCSRLKGPSGHSPLRAAGFRFACLSSLFLAAPELVLHAVWSLGITRPELFAQICFQQVEKFGVIHGFRQIVAASAGVTFLDILFFSARRE